MIIVRYRGGLGNQMFQYAFQLAIQQKYEGIPVFADLSHYRMQKEHNGFELERVFGIRLSQLSHNRLKKISPYYVPSDLFDCLPERIRRLIAQNLQYKYFKWRRPEKIEEYYRQEYHSSYEPEVFSLAEMKDWYLDGLWQDMRYFREQEEMVRKVFVFHNEKRYTWQDKKLLATIREKNSVGVHIRRGDFVDSKFDICSEEYYRRALVYMEDSLESPIYYFFSDDPDFAEKNFSYIKNKVIVRHSVEDSILDMEMLSQCRSAIISNSTFALWAAWLGRKKEQVIAPKYSVVKPEQKYELRVPEGWRQLES